MDPKRDEKPSKGDELPELPELPDAAELDELPELPDEHEPVAPEPEAEKKKPEPAVVEPELFPEPEPEPVAATPDLDDFEDFSLDDEEEKPATPASEPVAEESPELGEVPDLDDVPDLEPAAPVEELPELEEVAALEELSEEAAAAVPGEMRKNPDGTSVRRDLDKAPLLLRKAAVIVAIGSIAPWGSATGDFDWWLKTIPAKAILFLSAWIFHESHILTHHGKAPGFIRALGKKGPQPVWALAAIVAVAGLAPIFEGVFNFANFSEKVILLLATFTYTHIYDYEHGGKFNPIFPLMFLAPAVGGIGAIIKVFGRDPAAGIGAVVVTAGALFACYTMGVALKQAKIEGDAKRVAHREARKAARAAGRSVPKREGGTSRRTGSGSGSESGAGSRRKKASRTKRK